MRVVRSQPIPSGMANCTSHAEPPVAETPQPQGVSFFPPQWAVGPIGVGELFDATEVRAELDAQRDYRWADYRRA